MSVGCGHVLGPAARTCVPATVCVCVWGEGVREPIVPADAGLERPRRLELEWVQLQEVVFSQHCCLCLPLTLVVGLSVWAGEHRRGHSTSSCLVRCWPVRVRVMRCCHQLEAERGSGVEWRSTLKH